MRLLASFIISAFLISGCNLANTDDPVCNFVGFKYYNGEPDTLGELSTEYVLIGSDSNYTDNEIKGFVSSQSSFNQEYDFNIWQYPSYSRKQTVLKFNKSLSCGEITDNIESYQESSLVDYAHYTLQTDKCRNLIGEKIGEKCINSYSSLFYIKVRDTTDTSALESTVVETNTSILNQNRFMSNWFTLSADKNSMDDALHMANYFYETGLFEASEPDVIKLPVE